MSDIISLKWSASLKGPIDDNFLASHRRNYRQVLSVSIFFRYADDAVADVRNVMSINQLYVFCCRVAYILHQSRVLQQFSGTRQSPFQNIMSILRFNSGL